MYFIKKWAKKYTSFKNRCMLCKILSNNDKKPSNIGGQCSMLSGETACHDYFFLPEINHSAAGYTGANCSVEYDNCTSMTCDNGGTCIVGINGAVCVCLSDYSGPNCTTKISPCDSFPCAANSTCVNTPSSDVDYRCDCPTGQFLLFLNISCV